MPQVTTATASQGGISPVPSTIFSAREICELALGQIGDFSINDEGANPASMDRALRHLDMINAELAGTELCWWLIGSTYRFSWPADTRVDTVANIMGDQYPSLGIVTPISASLLDADGQFIRNLPLIRRGDYDELQNKDDVGDPDCLYFDRFAADATVSIYRVPDVATWQIELTAQTYSRSVLGSQNNTEQSGNLAHGFGPEWQKYLVNQLASEIGNGPVRSVDLRYISDWRGMATLSLAKLEAFANREKKSSLSRTKPWGR